MLGLPETIVLVLVALLLFGPSRLPKAARGIGQSLREFRKAMDGKTPPGREPRGTGPEDEA